MQHAALAGVHGREAVGTVGVIDDVDGFVGHFAQGRGALGLVAVGVEADAVVLFGFEIEDFGRDVLEGAEKLAFVVEEEIGVGALALNVEVAALQTVRIGCAGAGGDAVLEAKATGGSQQSHEGRHMFGGLREIFH
jgi:hypothetical protein